MKDKKEKESAMKISAKERKALGLELREAWSNAGDAKGLAKARKESARLIEAGADVSAADARVGWSALHFACCYGEGKDIEMLVKAGARVDQRSKKGEAPLMAALSLGWGRGKGALEAMIKAGADINERNKKGVSLTRVCMEKGMGEVVETLIRAGAPLWTPEGRVPETLWDRCWGEGGADGDIGWGALLIEVIGAAERKRKAALIEEKLRVALGLGRMLKPRDARVVIDWIEEVGRWRGKGSFGQPDRLDLALMMAMDESLAGEQARMIAKAPRLDVEKDLEGALTVIQEWMMAGRSGAGGMIRRLTDWLGEDLPSMERAALMWRMVGAMERMEEADRKLIKELRERARSAMEKAGLELIGASGKPNAEGAPKKEGRMRL